MLAVPSESNKSIKAGGLSDKQTPPGSPKKLANEFYASLSKAGWKHDTAFAVWQAIELRGDLNVRDVETACIVAAMLGAQVSSLESPGCPSALVGSDTAQSRRRPLPPIATHSLNAPVLATPLQQGEVEMDVWRRDPDRDSIFKHPSLGIASPKDILTSPTDRQMEDVVDEAVLNELPEELQDELKRAMRGQARAYPCF